MTEAKTENQIEESVTENLKTENQIEESVTVVTEDSKTENQIEESVTEDSKTENQISTDIYHEDVSIEVSKILFSLSQ